MATRKRKTVSFEDSEDIFLNQLLELKSYWGSIARKLEKSKIDAQKERSFEMSLKMLINEFSNPRAHEEVVTAQTEVLE